MFLHPMGVIVAEFKSRGGFDKGPDEPGGFLVGGCALEERPLEREFNGFKPFLRSVHA